MVKQSHRVSFDYEVRPGFLYVRSRAISSRCNDNFDEFPAEEIKKGYKTFVGKPVFVNHNNENHRRARGVIIDAVLHEDTNPDGSPDTWAEVLMEVDAVNFPKLADAIQKGHIDRTSMGTDVAYSICSACGNKATSPAEYCVHIPRQKGSRLYKADPKTGSKEGILIREICYGLSFFENSLLVEEPADPTAFFLGVDTSGLNKAASKTAHVPLCDYCDGFHDSMQHFDKEMENSTEAEQIERENQALSGFPQDTMPHPEDEGGFYDENRFYKGDKLARKTAADNPVFLAPKFEDFGSEDSYDDEENYENEPRKNKGQGSAYRPSWQTRRRALWRNRLKSAISEHGVSWVPFMNEMKETNPGINNQRLLGHYHRMLKQDPDNFHAFVQGIADKRDTPNQNPRTSSFIANFQKSQKTSQLLNHFASSVSEMPVAEVTPLRVVSDFNIQLREDGNIIITAREDDQILATAMANVSKEDKQVRMTSLEVRESSRGRGFGSNIVRLTASLPEYFGLDDSDSYTMRIIGSTDEAISFYDQLGAKVLQHYANVDTAPFVIWGKEARQVLAKDATLQFESYLDMADDLDSLMGDNKSMNDKPTDVHADISENDLFVKRGPVGSLKRQAFFEVFAHKLGEHPLDVEHGITKNGVQNLKDLYHASNDDEKSDGRRWYADGQHLSRALGGGDVEKGAGVLAAYSPQTEWDQNILNAAHHLATGSPPEKGWGVTPDSKSKSTKIMEGHSFDDSLAHPGTGKKKTWHFGHLLKNGGDDGSGTRHVAVDSWAIRALANNHEMKGGEKLLTRQRNYDHYADMYRTATDHLNSENTDNPDWEHLHPHQLQAITWVHIKNRSAQHGEESNKKGQKGRGTRSDNVNKKKKEVLKDMGIDESTTNEGNIHLAQLLQHFASPMGGTKDSSNTDLHPDAETSYCTTCNVKIFKVNDGSINPWQHDLSTGAGVAHQAVPREEDTDN
jgi:ribosomal protein L20